MAAIRSEIHGGRPHTLVVADPALTNLLQAGDHCSGTWILPLDRAEDLLDLLERHASCLQGLHTLTLAAAGRRGGLALGSVPLTAARVQRLQMRWRAALPATLTRVDLFVLAGRSHPALAMALAQASGAEVRVADGHRPDRLVTVADGTLSTITARNRILPMRRRGTPAPERRDC